MVNLTFSGMGTDIQVIIGPSDQGYHPQQAAQEVKELMVKFEKTASRFDPESEISALNRNPQEEIKVSAMLARIVEAAAEAAHQSKGLLDPTLAGELQSSGYQKSWREDRRISLAEVLQAGVPQRPGRANPKSSYAQIKVREGSIRRPKGVAIEVGATGKGLAVDMAAEILGDKFQYWMISAGGDLRSGGSRGWSQEVEIRHPLTDQTISEMLLDGALATSGLSRRIWDHDGSPHHHLLDPYSGKPAWSGLIQVSAAAPTCLEAERLAGEALLSGPTKARRILARYGGLMVDNQGRVEKIDDTPRLSASALMEVYG